MSETLAVFGGSFDPPHLAHVLVASYVLAAHELDRVLVVPTASHPWDKPLSRLPHRLRMCELAFAHLRAVEISSIEGELPRPNLTLHTLRAIARVSPAAQLRLVIGSDVLSEAHAWHAWDEVKALAPPIIVARQGHPSTTPDAPALPEISSTEIRGRLRRGEPTTGLLDPRVARYARDHALYLARL